MATRKDIVTEAIFVDDAKKVTQMHSWKSDQRKKSKIK